MPRSTHVYVVMEVGGLPVAAFTVKHELTDWLARRFDAVKQVRAAVFAQAVGVVHDTIEVPAFATLDVYRLRDGGTNVLPERMGTALDVLNAHQEAST